MRIAYSFGIFDLLHCGHVNALEFARAHSDLHVVGLVSDAAAEGWMGSLVSGLEERRRVLSALSCVDEVAVQATFDPVENLRALHERWPAARITLYHGDDWKVVPAREYLGAIGGDVVLTGYYGGITPQVIRERLLAPAPGRRRPPAGGLLSTKADTLATLRPLVRRSRIGEPLVVTVGEALDDPAGAAARVAAAFGGDDVAVRSSCSQEDGCESSNAGHFRSELGVPSSDPAAVAAALLRVAGSYGDDLAALRGEQVLVQRQLRDVACAGVVFTRDVNEDRPYYLVDYDDSGATDSVTGGERGASVWVARDAPLGSVPERWRGLLSAVRELEGLLPGMVLDVEFAVGRSGEVWVLQVRPLAASYRFESSFDDAAFVAVRERAREGYLALPRDGGEPPALSDMAFWNPAEIVGVNPHPLDYSLYRAAVTRSAWNEGLVPLGYRRVPEELMCRVGNKPYVRLRPAFRSLIPAALDDGLARRLEDLYMRALASDWTAHDKIEFEVACSCWDLSAGRRVDGWVSEGLTVADARAVGEALRALTAGAVRGFPGWAARDGADSARLGRAVGEAAREMGSGSLGAEGLLAVADRLLGACCSLGTPQFARQARLAFVSRSICRSAVEEGVVGAAEMDAYLAGLSTVAGELGRDLAACAAGELPEGEFMRRYGHLRSGTYDITSPRYDAMPIEAVFGDAARRPPAGPAPGPGGGLGPGDLARVASGLGLDREGDAEALGRFLRGALESRERFKFEFTKALSLALEAVAAVGERVGLGRGDMAFLTVEDLRAAPCYPGRERGAFLRDMSAQRRARFEEDSPLVLPDVLDGPGSLDVVEFASARPNFVTGGSIVAEAASHMAIRCAEFGLPAAIGCGRRIFSRLRGARAISIDCRGQRVEARP